MAQLTKGRSRRQSGRHPDPEEGGNKDTRSHALCGKIPRIWLIRSTLVGNFAHSEHISEASSQYAKRIKWCTQEWWFKAVHDAVRGKASCPSQGIPASGQENLAAPTKHKLQQSGSSNYLLSKAGAGAGSYPLGLNRRLWTCWGLQRDLLSG